ncbi:hypothetical protein SB6413_05734 [Klebsiella pasteurii]|nr:hypothetical protein SB6413_05734 [Klebsiella pasteurii]
MSQYLHISDCKRMDLMTTLITTFNEISAPRNPVLTASNIPGVGHC